MFTCSQCKTPTGPRISPVTVIAEQRRTEYPVTREDPETGEVSHSISVGTEIVSELRLCPDCSNTRALPEVPQDMSGFLTLASVMQAHAKGCRKVLADCPKCQANVSAFATFPLGVLSKVLQ